MKYKRSQERKKATDAVGEREKHRARNVDISKPKGGTVVSVRSQFCCDRGYVRETTKINQSIKENRNLYEERVTIGEGIQKDGKVENQTSFKCDIRIGDAIVNP